jgi:hypothetical protein
MYLPRDICNEMQRILGLTWDSASEHYLIEDYASFVLDAEEPTLEFALAPLSYTRPISHHDLQMLGTNISLPYKSWARELGFPQLAPGRNSLYLPIRPTDDLNQYVLGRSFLQEAYLIANYERRKFTINQVNWTKMADRRVPWVLPILAQDPYVVQSYLNDVDRYWMEERNTTSENDIGSLVGAIVVAVTLFIGVLVGLFYYFRDRRRRKERRIAEEENAIVEKKLHEADGASTEIVEIRGAMVYELPQSDEIVTIHHGNVELDASQQEVLEMGDTQVAEYTTMHVKVTVAQVQGSIDDRTRYPPTAQQLAIPQAGIEIPASPIPKTPAEYYDRNVYPDIGPSKRNQHDN